MRKVIFALGTGIVLLGACKKDNNKSTRDKIQGKWQFISSISIGVDNGQIIGGSTTGLSSDYMDLRNDGMAYLLIEGEYDTVAYKLIDDSRIVVDGDAAAIKILTNNSFIFSNHQEWTGGYTNTTISLKK